VGEDPKWELAILATVQGFYEKLLQESVEGEVPIPSGLETVSLQSDEADVNQTLTKMRRWLRLLDMAITPAMLRRALTLDTDPEIAEALLRYFSRRKELGAVNRDKTDLVATFLYTHPRVPGQWERRGYGLDGSLPLSPFEIALLEILADSEAPSLPEDHLQLLRRFDPLCEEAETFRDLNTLMESGIISRVRDLKQAFELSFYHPGVPAPVPVKPRPAVRPSLTWEPPAVDVPAMRANVTPQQVSGEETKLLKIEESIRIFVRVADPKFRQVVPMRFFNLTLTPAEADSYCADYLEEKSLRAGVSRVLLRLVAIGARINTELEELKRCGNSPSLWKMHSDSLIVLLEIARSVGESAGRVANLAAQQGQTAQSEAIQASLKRLRDYSDVASKTLSRSGEQRTVASGAV
jgi:hypothetical protein